MNIPQNTTLGSQPGASPLPASGTFQPLLEGGVGKMLVLNHTPFSLVFGFDTLGDQNGFNIRAGATRLIVVDSPVHLVYYAVKDTLVGGVAVAPANVCVIEYYKLDEEVNPTSLGPLGGIVGVNSLVGTQLGTQNDGEQMSVPTSGASTGTDTLSLYSSVSGPGTWRSLQHQVVNAGNALNTFLENGSAGTAILEIQANLQADSAATFSAAAAFVAAVTFANIVSKYNNVTTAGNGLIAAVADTGVAGVTVTLTTQQTILTFTPAANGMYRVGARLRLNNGTSSQTITLQVSFTDADTGVAQVLSFFGNAGGTAILVLGALAAVPNGLYGLAALDIKAKGGTAISVIYRDAGGTPNDIVNASIEWLA